EPLFPLRVGGIPHLAHRVRLRDEPLEVIDEPFPTVVGILVVPADVDRFLRAHFLAVAAEDAAELVDLEHERIAITLLVFAGHELDAVGRADGRTETARHALRLARLGGQHPVRAPPAWRERRAHFRILRRHLVRVDHVLEREAKPADHRPHVAGLLNRPLEDLHADTHCFRPPPDARPSTRHASARAPRRGHATWPD